MSQISVQTALDNYNNAIQALTTAQNYAANVAIQFSCAGENFERLVEAAENHVLTAKQNLEQAEQVLTAARAAGRKERGDANASSLKLRDL